MNRSRCKVVTVLTCVWYRSAGANPFWTDGSWPNGYHAGHHYGCQNVCLGRFRGDRFETTFQQINVYLHISSLGASHFICLGLRRDSCCMWDTCSNHQAGPRFTNGFSIAIQIRLKFRFTFDPNTVIATKFCTWHDSCAVVACAKICCDLFASSGITARRSFHRIWIAGKKSLVKRVPHTYIHTYIHTYAKRNRIVTINYKNIHQCHL